MFDELTVPDARPILWLKRLFVIVVVALLLIGAVSSHRAYFQVRSLELQAPHSLSAGSVVNTSVVGSGRTMVDVDVDLIQGTHSERLMRLHLTGNELAFFDPRSQHGFDSVVLTSETLSKFQPGPLACERSRPDANSGPASHRQPSASWRLRSKIAEQSYDDDNKSHAATQWRNESRKESGSRCVFLSAVAPLREKN